MAVKRDGSRPVRNRPSFSAVVLAAGAGRRFGGGKLMAPWRGGVLLDGALTAAFAAPAAEVILVQGADARVAAAAQAHAARSGAGERLRLTAAPDWAEGRSASLRAGLAAVPAGRAGAFVFLGDMPDVPADMAARLAERFDGEAAAVVPEFAGELGHPALIAAALFPEAGSLSGDRGARAVLTAQGARLVRVPAGSPGVLFDVDTPAALLAG